MAIVRNTIEPLEYDARSGLLKRISWGAIFAGLVVALVIQMLFSLLGMGIGLGSINPATSNNPFSGLGTAAAVWMGLSALIALFLGGWVTARMSGSLRGMNGFLHSIVMWGLVTLASVYFVTTAMGALLSGAAGAIGKSVAMLGRGAAEVAPQATDTIKNKLQEQGITLDNVMNEAKVLLSQTGKPELQPQQIQQDINQAQNQAAQATTPTAGSQVTQAQTPEAVQQELRQAIQKLVAGGTEKINAADRQAVVNILTARTNMNQAEAEKTVDGWVQKYRELAQAAEQAKQKALKTTENAMDSLSSAGIWLFVLLLLEAFAAGLGGWLGSRGSSINYDDGRVESAAVR